MVGCACVIIIWSIGFSSVQKYTEAFDMGSLIPPLKTPCAWDLYQTKLRLITWRYSQATFLPLHQKIALCFDHMMSNEIR